MKSTDKLLNQLDQAVSEFKFPIWDIDEDSSAITGAMRVSGFTSSSGIGLIFESIEYTKTENVIQCMVRCFATLPVRDWLESGDGIYVPYDDMIDGETGKFIVDFGTFDIVIRDKKFNVNLDKTELINEGYIDNKSETLTKQALLFRICDTLPKDFLFSSLEFFKKAFELPEDTIILFSIDDWEHPSIEIYEDDDIKPSNYEDIRVMVTTLEEKRTKLDLKGTPNTSWKYQIDNQ
ncbi:MAG: hypothetical protein QNJ32_27750 [Xenococcaceae cyanobacterium MO_167.B27]|nr:hypothetical protein [Xenococcaceae cyanobacterium MO_167.B27]